MKLKQVKQSGIDINKAITEFICDRAYAAMVTGRPMSGKAQLLQMTEPTQPTMKLKSLVMEND